MESPLNLPSLLRTLLYSTALLTIISLLLLLFKQLLSYLRLSKYRKQGIKCFYYPIYGMKKILPKGTYNKKVRKNLDEVIQGAQVIATNSLFTTEPHVCLTGTKYLKDFFLLENGIFKRTGPAEDINHNRSFLYENGDVALRHRAIFTDFFRAENIKKIIPKIEAIFEESFKSLALRLFPGKLELGDAKELNLKKGVTREELGWRRLDFYPHLKEPFDKTINMVLFGSQTKEESPIFEGGKFFSEAVSDLIFLKVMATFNLPNILTGGLIRRLNLSADSRKYSEEAGKIFDTMKAFYDKRKASGRFDGVNLLDLMIRHNERAALSKSKNQQKRSTLDGSRGSGHEEETIESTEKSIDTAEGSLDQLDYNQIVDFMRLFYVAGYDTSKANAGVGVYNLSRYAGFRKNFYSEVKNLNSQNPTQRDYSSGEFINAFVSENLRLLGPISNAIPRYCTKTCKIGDLTIYEGSLLSIRYDLLHTDPEVYDSATEFNPERFADKKWVDQIRRNLSNIPFSAGRRSCAAKYLGEVLVKIVLRTVLTVFEIRWDGESEREMRPMFSLEPAHVRLELRPRIGE